MNANYYRDFKQLSLVPPWAWLLLLVALFIQGMWIFRDAEKRGENKWLWGILGLMNIPTNLLIYLIVTRRILRPIRCPECNKKIPRESNYCLHCGTTITNKKA